jgi:hypothetical protein
MFSGTADMVDQSVRGEGETALSPKQHPRC